MFPVRDTIPSRHAPLVTVSLIIINSILFLLQSSIPHEGREALAYLFGLVPARYTSPDWQASSGMFPTPWPFLTHMFMHGSFFHLFSNMWSLWLFGDNVEDRMGSWRFLLFYLLCGILASFTHIYINPDSTLPTVGASGAIAGVMGAYFTLFPRARLIMFFPIIFIPVFFEMSAFFYLAYWFIMEIIRGTASLQVTEEVGGIAFWAHIGGFAAGFLLHRFFLLSRRDYRPWYPDEDIHEYPYRGFRR
jgi:membrane associated rhomboid family serine protease